MKFLKKIMCILLILLMCGCTGSKKYTAYTIYPIGYLLNRIGGNRIEPISIQNRTLVQVANIVEDYADILENSSVLFHIGDLEPYMDLYSEQVSEIVDLSAGDLSVLNFLYRYMR